MRFFAVKARSRLNFQRNFLARGEPLSTVFSVAAWPQKRQVKTSKIRKREALPFCSSCWQLPRAARADGHHASRESLAPGLNLKPFTLPACSRRTSLARRRMSCACDTDYREKNTRVPWKRLCIIDLVVDGNESS